jgi:ferric iron reductase protein FhuF
MAATSFAELVRPVADTLCAIDRRGRRGVWAEVGEAFAGGVFLAARAVGRPHDAPEEVSRLRALAPPDLGQPVGWVDVPHAGGAVPWKRRTVCCLAYQTPRWAGEYCATCPLIPREETARRIGDWLRGGR